MTLATRYIGCGLGLLLAMTFSHAYADPLTDTLIATYNFNPAIKAKREELEALDEGVSQAVSGWRPVITGDYGRGRQRTDAGAGRTYGDSETRQIALVQPIFSGGQTVALTKQSKNLVRSGRAELLSIEQQTLLDAVQAYMDVVQNNSVLQLSTNNSDVLGKQLKASQERFDVGEVTRTDVAQSQARQARAQSEVIQAQSDVEAARATYRRIVGVDAGDLPLPELKPLLPATLEEAQAIALANNPLVGATRFRSKAAQNEVDVRTADILPEVSLQAVSRKEEGAGAFGSTDFDQDAVTVNLSLPLYQGGAEYARVREAKNTAQRRRFEELDTFNQVRETVTRAWEQYQASKGSITSTSAAIQAAETALEGVTQEQQYGARTTLDVLDAEQELFIARVNLVRAQRNEVVSYHNLLAAMGRLTAQQLALNTPLHDPRIHYDDVKYKLIGF